MKPIKVLVVDDHAIVRAGLRALLETGQDIHVVGEAENGQQAVLQAKRLRPDVVLLDLAMPVLNGVEAARQIADEAPSARVLILSTYNDVQHLQQAVEAGAAGYLMKEAAGDDLLQAIRAARDGTVFFSPPVLKNLLKEWKKGPAHGRRDTARSATLSRRQAEVLQLIAEGHCTKQIAGLLSICTKTAEKHRQSLMEKLNLRKIATLTQYAVSSGVIESGRIPGWHSGRPFRRERPFHLNYSWRTV